MINQILIIDDDKELCALLQKSVQTENIHADCRYSGRDGLAALAENSYQLVVLDVMMPGTDGFETLETIRTKSPVPVLMLTAKDDSASKVRGLRSGADDYLTKPFDMEEFIARVVSLIRRYTRFNNTEPDNGILSYKGLKINLNEHCVTTERGTFELPNKEFELLLYLAHNQGKIVTKSKYMRRFGKGNTVMMTPTSWLWSATSTILKTVTAGWRQKKKDVAQQAIIGGCFIKQKTPCEARRL